MARKRPRLETSQSHQLFLTDFQPPISSRKGPVEAWRFPGFRPLFLPVGTVCLIERPDSDGPPSRILILNRSVSLFHKPREFWRLRQVFQTARRDGEPLCWIAFYPGRRKPQYVFLAIPRDVATNLHHFSGGGFPGRPKKVAYDAIRQFHREHPKSSQARIAKRFGVSRPTVTRALGSEESAE